MNKRGLSRVITVLLLIFLAVAATIFIWNVARIFIEREAEMSKLKTQLLLERMEIVKVEINPLDPLDMTLSLRKNNEKVRYIGTETLPGTPAAIDIISVVDLSGSMRRCLDVASGPCCTSDLSGLYSSNTCRGIPDPNLKSTCEDICNGIWNDKLTPAKEANKELVAQLISSENDNKIGLIGYSKNIETDDTLSLTKNSNDLIEKINSWPIRSGTRICLGIIEAKKMFLVQSPAEKPKAMIVMSDGKATESCISQFGSNVGDMDENGVSDTDEDYAIYASKDAFKSVPNLVIYAIGFGETSTPGDLDENTLQEIADFGGGQYYKANVDNIVDVYKSVAEQIVKKYQTIKVMDYLRIVFYSDTLSYQDIIPNPPEKMYELKKYQFNIPPEMTNIKRIEIYPIILTASGEEVIGPLLDVQKFM